MTRLIFFINYYCLIEKFQDSVKLLEMIYQVIENYRKLICLVQSGGFLGRLLETLLKTALPLMKNVVKPLAESVLILLGLTAAASAADTGIHKEMLGSGVAVSIISNKEMNDIKL